MNKQNKKVKVYLKMKDKSPWKSVQNQKLVLSVANYRLEVKIKQVH